MQYAGSSGRTSTSGGVSGSVVSLSSLSSLLSLLSLLSLVSASSTPGAWAARSGCRASTVAQVSSSTGRPSVSSPLSRRVGADGSSGR